MTRALDRGQRLGPDEPIAVFGVAEGNENRARSQLRDPEVRRVDHLPDRVLVSKFLEPVDRLLPPARELVVHESTNVLEHGCTRPNLLDHSESIWPEVPAVGGAELLACLGSRGAGHAASDEVDVVVAELGEIDLAHVLVLDSPLRLVGPQNLAGGLPVLDEELVLVASLFETERLAASTRADLDRGQGSAGHGRAYEPPRRFLAATPSNACSIAVEPPSQGARADPRAPCGLASACAAKTSRRAAGPRVSPTRARVFGPRRTSSSIRHRTPSFRPFTRG